MSDLNPDAVVTVGQMLKLAKEIRYRHHRLGGGSYFSDSDHASAVGSALEEVADQIDAVFKFCSLLSPEERRNGID